MLHHSFEGFEGGSIDMAMVNWMSVRLLLDFDAKLLYGFTVPIKGEGGG